jgi:hypothetical protein
MNPPNARVLAAEFAGTFMLVLSILGAAFHAFDAPEGAAYRRWPTRWDTFLAHISTQPSRSG